jgi:hypothetical protein
MDEDERLSRLINYNFFGFQNTDLQDILCEEESSGVSFVNLRDYKERTTQPSKACFLGFLSCQDSTYIMYAYQYCNIEYGFAWETFYDESHRNSTNINDPPWFDFIEQGQLFKIELNPKNPKEHIINERPFREMNDTVICLGTSPCR